LLVFSGGNENDYKITSFLVDDVNNDDINDLIIGIDCLTEDGLEKTIIARAI
jgi:hypothetical protein